jgi:hypothetical protein
VPDSATTRGPRATISSAVMVPGLAGMILLFGAA